jgi:hypothetical protein
MKLIQIYHHKIYVDYLFQLAMFSVQNYSSMKVTFLLALFCFSLLSESEGISCRDSSDREVDWWVMKKMPRSRGYYYYVAPSSDSNNNNNADVPTEFQVSTNL